MNRPDFIKNLSMPSSDEMLSYAGLRREPSFLGQFFAGAGLIGLGALVGAGVSLWFSSPRTRKQVTATLNNGLDLLTDKVMAKPATARSMSSSQAQS